MQTTPITAFTIDQAARLSGLSEAQLRRWDEQGLFSPALGWENRRRPLARIYSFGDIVALRTLSKLKTWGVSTQRLKKIKAFLDPLVDDPWGRRFWLNRQSGEVYFDYEDAIVAAKPVGQIAMIELVELGPIADDVQQQLEILRSREGEHGRVIEDRFIHGGQPIFAGTRILLSSVIEILEEGADDETIFREFPRLNGADLDEARRRIA